MRGPPKILRILALPRPLHGVCGVLDRRFAGRSPDLSSMRRTANMEPQMSTIQHPHAAYDRFPQLVQDLTEEFGSEGIGAVVERFIEAELAEFCWEGLIAEKSLGLYEDGFDEDEEPLELV